MRKKRILNLLIAFHYFFFNMEELYIKKGQMNPSAQEETQPERPNNDNNY